LLLKTYRFRPSRGTRKNDGFDPISIEQALGLASNPGALNAGTIEGRADAASQRFDEKAREIRRLRVVS